MSKLTTKKRKTVPAKKTKIYIYLIFLIVLPLALNWKNLGYGFTTIDDSAIIENNYEFLKDFKNVFKAFEKDNFMSDGGVNYYRPIQTVSFMIDTQMNSETRNVYHLSNIIYHILTVLVLFFLLIKLEINKDVSFYVSLLFSVHPLLTDAIAWIPGRGDLLAGLFCTASLLFFLYYQSTKNKLFIILNSAAFLLALFSKEVSVILPFILIYSYWLIQKNKFQIRSLVPFILIWGSSVIIFFYLRHLYLFSQKDLKFSTFISNLPVIPIFWSKLILPLELSPLPVYNLLYVLIGLIFFILSFVYIKKLGLTGKSLIILGIVWFIGFIIPAMFVKLQIEKIYFEYLECRAYLPSIGIFMVLGVLMNEIVQKKGIKIIIKPFVIVILIFAIISYIYSQDYSDATKYFSSLIKSNPSNSFAFNQRGCIHYSQNEIDLAIEDFNNAIKVNPANSDPYYNKGIVFDYLKDYKQAEQSYAMALNYDTLNPKSNRLYENVFVSLSLDELNLKKYDDAIKVSMLGIAKYPDAFYLHKNLGQAYYNTAKFDLALNQYDRTIMLKPDYSDAYFFRGMTKMNLTKYEAAISDFNNSIRLDVQNGQAYYFRGLMYSKLSKNIEAKVDYNKSLELGYKGVPYNE